MSGVTWGERKVYNQRPLIRLMVLTSNSSMCVFCGQSEAVEVDHAEPVGDNGADIWWNYLPSCVTCNRMKGKNSAQNWKIDMEMSYSQPTAYSIRRLPLEVCRGLMDRVRKTQEEIRDPARRDWFRHHFGDVPRHRRAAQFHKLLSRCRAELAEYPYPPWTDVSRPDYPDDVCTRRICCGWRHENYQFIGAFLTKAELAAFQAAAHAERMHTADILSRLIRQYLATSSQEEAQEGS